MRKSGLPPVVDKNTEFLILGTLPSDKSLAAGRYYANPSNDFWRLVGAALNRSLDSLLYEGRLALLKANRVGLWDAYHSCIRLGSMDGNITEQELNDFESLKSVAPNIRLVCFNGRGAADAEKSLVRLGYHTCLLPSSSGANRRDQERRLACWKSSIAASPEVGRIPNTRADSASINEGGTAMPKLQTLFGDGCAVVVGLPENFNLSGALRSAKEIRLATAFAHVSGWKSLKADVEASAGDIFLLTGLECNQTEPAVLRDWLDLHLRKGKAVTAKLASSKPFFHPKVLIVHSPKEQFAIVSSGNLSNGGLQTNCECGMFVGDAPTVATLCDWFDEQFRSGDEFNGGMIDTYEPHYKKAKKQIAALAQQQKKTEEKLKVIGEASFAKWSRALELADAFFRNKDFNTKYANRKLAAQALLQPLNVPKFDFDKNGWGRFYEQRVLGKLNPLYRDRVFKAGNRLRNALRLLIRDPHATIPAILGKKGKLRISGFAENTVSKILAANCPSEWFVYNSRVPPVLADFGYKAQRGVGRDGRYIAYCNEMKKFMSACKERGLSGVDAISLDEFILERSGVLKRKKVSP